MKIISACLLVCCLVVNFASAKPQDEVYYSITNSNNFLTCTNFPFDFHCMDSFKVKNKNSVVSDKVGSNFACTLVKASDFPLTIIGSAKGETLATIPEPDGNKSVIHAYKWKVNTVVHNYACKTFPHAGRF